MKSFRLLMLLCWACFEPFLVAGSSPVRISLKGKEQKLLKIIVTQDASVHVTGYKGSDLIISTKEDTAATHVTGYVDISELAVSVSKQSYTDFAPRILETGGMIEMVLQYTNSNDINIQIPKQTHFALQFVSHLPQSSLILSRLSGELTISANVPSIVVDRITGPLSLIADGLNLKKTISISHINWDNGKPGSLKLFITALNADVALSLPSSLKASLNLKAPHNSIYSDLPGKQLKHISDDHGNLVMNFNGGGASIFVTTEYGNITLRKEP
ncbi:MAG: hypothetical protein JWQ66_1791 [Mucilaginibacter sp.]|nr:hypothetical protein [Mucilaginibacter sp.]